MKIRPGVPRYRRNEEIVNSLSHGVGAVLAVAGLIVLTRSALLQGDAWHVASCAVYGVTLVILYSASTLYHLVPLSRAKVVFQFLDHSAIYLLIAGTYTPFTLVNLRGPWGWSLFGAVWGLALLGIVSRATVVQHRPGMAVAFYVAMGWVAVIAVKPILTAIAPGGLLLLLAGSLAYTLGVIFYAWERLPYNHAVWHLFVLAGSAFQFFAVWFYVVPPA
jgi:hemolysin III